VNFIEDGEQEQILPYLLGLFNSILDLLVRSKPFVQDRALAALSSLASSAESRFNPYYARVMPLLLEVLEREHPSDHQAVHDLKGRAVECAGRIGGIPSAPGQIRELMVFRV
jgi:hypothetical protein